MNPACDAIGGVPLPTFAQIEPVGRCNLRCRMCPVQFRPETHGKAPATMDFDTYRRHARFRAALASDTPPEICRTCSLYRGSF
jgi:hypothetical protein